MSEKVTKWVSKYALSSGIENFLGEIRIYDGREYFHIDGRYGLFSKEDFHETEEAAIAKARQMRDKKIASLRAQIKKLEGMFV